MDPGQLLLEILPAQRVKTRLIDLLGYAADAGFYRLIPKAVVQPVSEAEIISIFKLSNLHQIPMVFRTGGTSLSGQSITDGILVDLSQYWDRIKIEQNGELVRVQPGITGGMTNAYLKKFSRKIGPDPASINSAMIGGILSNNSSGMCCGVKLNAYHTIKFIRFILPDGNIFSTETASDYSRFEQEYPDLYNLLGNTRKDITANDTMYQKIRAKYRIKNTIGYSFNAFIDFEHPLDILAHLIIGAEGTLAFISEAVLQTVPDYQFSSTALLYFPDITSACDAIGMITSCGARAVELMDRPALRAIEHLPDLPSVIKDLPDSAAALLIEFQEDDYAKLETNVNHFLGLANQISLLHAPAFTSNPKEQANYWKVRKGLFPSVGAVRLKGSTVILEDVAFPIEKLGDAIADLQILFEKYAYHNAIIFGHAKDGNLHFVITPSFNNADEVKKYDRFMQELAPLVVNKYNGSLKAEHGTGRNMAPFVEAEWGHEIYALMEKIKLAIDPKLLLNPGVIINADKEAHIKNIKSLPTVEQEVDKCIECGFCEHKCPSRNLTTTPRRRIVLRRELKNLSDAGNIKEYKVLLEQYQYDAMDTCAVDGLCASACPVDINTGDLIKRLRRENHSRLANSVALAVARNFKIVVWAARAALAADHVINKIVGKGAMTSLTLGIRRLFPGMPVWSAEIARPPRLAALKSGSLFNPDQPADQVVYFPSCISRMLGGSGQGKKNIMETFLSVCRKANINIKLIENINGSCCSQVFSSKGYQAAYSYTANRIVEQLWQSSDGGKIKVVIDVSSCAYSLKNLRPVLTAENIARFDLLTILDSVEYLHDRIMPGLQIKNKKQSIVLHPVCSLQKMQTQEKFIQLANAFAKQVTVPHQAGCCGMAGDRGFLFPELTASAALPEALEVSQCVYDGYYSSTKTCEMAMSQAVKQNYESILYLVDEAT